MSMLPFSEEVLLGTMGVPKSQSEKHSSQFSKQDMLKQDSCNINTFLFL